MEQMQGVASIAALKLSIQALCDAGVRRTRFFKLAGEGLRAFASEPEQIRRARAFALLLDEVELAVLPVEKLGGSILGMWPVWEEQPYEAQLREAHEVIRRKLDAPGAAGGRALMARDHYDASASFAVVQRLIAEVQASYADSERIRPQAIAKALEDHFVFDYTQEGRPLVDALPWAAANHVHLNYGYIVKTGYGALLSRIEALEVSASEAHDWARQQFYAGEKIAIEAAIRFIRRYARAYSAAAEQEGAPARAQELYQIADTLRTVSTERAGNFREAMQLMWITHIIANMQLGSALSFGRFDQYMFPYYKADLAAGRISEAEARELIAHMILKVNEPKMRTVQSMALGGTTPEGQDAANPLTAIVLQAARLVRMPYPNISVRVASALTPEWVYDEALETIRAGFGMPMLLNDDVWVKNFMGLGYPAEYAREYYNMGCVEMMIQNRQAHWCYAVGSPIHYPKLLEGIMDDHCAGALPLDTFDALMAELLRRIEVQVAAMGTLEARAAVARQYGKGYDPFASALLYDCLGKGKDMYHGGMELPAQVAVGGMGLATAADALSAIRTLVFERNELSLPQLLAAVRANFEGHEPLRLRLRHGAAHYGNDEDGVDDIAAALFNRATAAVHGLNGDPQQDRFVNSYFSYTSHVSMGELSGATPDGRRAGEPFSDGLGPAQGRDAGGPTKLFNSLLKLDFRHLTGACATNCRINPALLSTDAGVRCLKQLIKAYLGDGGPQLQLNFVRQQDLLAAQRDPLSHRDIVVRIAGFCEYFINLDHRQQDEIIARTEHEEL